MSNIWEDFICRNSLDVSELKHIGLASEVVKDQSDILVKRALAKDNYPIPTSEDRELYNPFNDSMYWISGFFEAKNIIEQIYYYRNVKTLLELGCSSGRILRHMALQHKIQSYGCDINYKHIRWISHFLPNKITAFQNTSIPHLPFEDNYLDTVIALSVFTHIESLDLMWIMEIKRILQPGGIAYITIHTENTINNLPKDHGLYNYISQHNDFNESLFRKELNQDKLIYRFSNNRSYSSHVFHNTKYIKRTWGNIMNIENIKFRFPENQDLVILSK